MASVAPIVMAATYPGSSLILARPAWVMEGYQIRDATGATFGNDGAEFHAMSDAEVKRTLRTYLTPDTAKISVYFTKDVGGIKHHASVIVRLDDAGKIKTKEFSLYTDMVHHLPRREAGGGAGGDYQEPVDMSPSNTEICQFMLFTDILLVL